MFLKIERHFQLSYLNTITTLIKCFNGCISMTKKAIYFKMFQAGRLKRRTWRSSRKRKEDFHTLQISDTPQVVGKMSALMSRGWQTVPRRREDKKRRLGEIKSLKNKLLKVRTEGLS